MRLLHRHDEDVDDVRDPDGTTRDRSAADEHDRRRSFFHRTSRDEPAAAEARDAAALERDAPRRARAGPRRAARDEVHEEVVERRRRWDTFGFLTAAYGTALAAMGTVALVRTGIDESWYRPVTEVAGVRQSPLMGAIELGCRRGAGTGPALRPAHVRRIGGHRRRRRRHGGGDRAEPRQPRAGDPAGLGDRPRGGLAGPRPAAHRHAGPPARAPRRPPSRNRLTRPPRRTSEGPGPHGPGPAASARRRGSCHRAASWAHGGRRPTRRGAPPVRLRRGPATRPTGGSSPLPECPRGRRRAARGPTRWSSGGPRRPAPQWHRGTRPPEGRTSSISPSNQV